MEAYICVVVSHVLITLYIDLVAIGVVDLVSDRGVPLSHQTDHKGATGGWTLPVAPGLWVGWDTISMVAFLVGMQVKCLYPSEFYKYYIIL